LELDIGFYANLHLHKGSVFSFNWRCLLYSISGFMTTSPLWGHLSDKIGKRKPFIILGLFISGLLPLLYAVLRNSFHFLLATIFVTVFNAASLPTSYAFLSEHVEMKGEGVGKYEAYTSIG